MRNIRLAIYYQENGKSKTSLGGDEMKKYLALFMGMLPSPMKLSIACMKLSATLPIVGSTAGLPSVLAT